MCGRFTFQPTEAVYARFEITNRRDSLIARYTIAPGQIVPVVIATSPRQIVRMRWGLIPHGAKDARTAYKMINARMETLTQRPAFRGLLSHNRALVPACGYTMNGRVRDETKRWTISIPRMISISRLPVSTIPGPHQTGRTSTPSPPSRPTRIPSWLGFTTGCRSSWRESWKRPS
jgi:hypothetical protein